MSESKTRGFNRQDFLTATSALGAGAALAYRRWRESNPEDTLRFHALRLHEVGMIKSTPQQIVDRGSDFRFLNELKKELKA